MSLELRILLFLALMFLFFFAYGKFLEKTGLAPPQKAQPSKNESAPEKRKPESPQKPATLREPEKLSSSVPPLQESTEEWEEIHASEEKEIHILTKTYDIRWSNRGGVPLSWKLRKYFDDKKQPLELLPQFPELQMIRPFQFITVDGKWDEMLNRPLYKVEKKETEHSIVLTFTYASSDIFVKKEFRIPKNGYLLQVSTVLKQRKKDKPLVRALIWGPGLENLGPKQQKALGWSFRPVQGIYYIDKVNKFKSKHENTHLLIRNLPLQWIGVHSNFFMATFLPPEGENVLPPSLFTLQVFSTKNEDELKTLLKKYKDVLMVTGVTVQDATPSVFRVFIGPKDIEILTQIHETLPECIQYGFFGFFSKMLLVLLKFFYNKFFPNYGIAIILTTLLIRLLLWPLSHKMFVNSERMKEIQPKIRAINEKYKGIPLTDPRRKKMNEEVMRLYSEHGVSPLSGCLPMLLQIPILFGFYRLLSVAIELRGAPFILWIHDLSKPDPYLITPILMGISMILQQKLSPTTVDPKQQRLSYIFSIVFTYMFANAQSGLVLYWLFNNVFTIAQQQFYHRILLKSKPPQRKKGKKARKSKK